MPECRARHPPRKPDQPEVWTLLEALDHLPGHLYAPEANHILGVQELLAPEDELSWWHGVPAERRWAPAPCGACRANPARAAMPYGEIKRMYVDPAQRGQRIGARLLAALEDALRRDGIAWRCWRPAATRPRPCACTSAPATPCAASLRRLPRQRPVGVLRQGPMKRRTTMQLHAHLRPAAAACAGPPRRWTGRRACRPRCTPTALREGAAAQRLAMQWAVRVNEAYQRLKDPLTRAAAYLCELRGVPIDAENNTAMPGGLPDAADGSGARRWTTPPMPPVQALDDRWRRTSAHAGRADQAAGRAQDTAAAAQQCAR
jgi:GNAT superfamily N-acetyltransferase